MKTEEKIRLLKEGEKIWSWIAKELKRQPDIFDNTLDAKIKAFFANGIKLQYYAFCPACEIAMTIKPRLTTCDNCPLDMPNHCGPGSSYYLFSNDIHESWAHKHAEAIAKAFTDAIERQEMILDAENDYCYDCGND